MAEGGAIENPVFDPDDFDWENDDDSRDEETNPLIDEPVETSTPKEEIRMRTIPFEKASDEEPSFFEIPSLRGFTHKDDKPALLERAKDFIRRRFPKADFKNIDPIGFGKQEGNDSEIVTFGKRGHESRIFKRGGKGLLKSFTDRFKTSLGPEAELLISEEASAIKGAKKDLKEAELQLKNSEKAFDEKQKAEAKAEELKERIEKAQAKIDQMGSQLENEAEVRDLQQRIKNYKTDLHNSEKEVAALQKLAKEKEKERVKYDKLVKDLEEKEKQRDSLEERLNTTKSFDELKERVSELQSQNRQDREVIRNPETSTSERQAAEARVDERVEEIARLDPQIAERERQMPLRERVKEIFKKYGVTIGSVFLAAGLTIGVVVGEVTRALKATGKALGDGLKEIGKKTASILPGLLGSIVSFLFKTAG